MTDAFERAVRLGDAALFDDITVRNQSAETDASGDPVRDDDYGDIVWADPVDTAVPGEIVTRGTPQFDHRADGIEADADAVAWVSDPDVTVTNGSDDEATKATRLIGYGATFVVRETFEEPGGRVRAHCEFET